MAKNISLHEIIEWIDKLKEKNLIEFEYDKLPIELKFRKYLQKASQMNLLRSIGKNKDGNNIWRITINVKPRIHKNKRN